MLSWLLALFSEFPDPPLPQLRFASPESESAHQSAQSPLAVLIVGVFAAIAVTGSPRHYLCHGRAFPAKQKPVLILEALQPAWRYIVLALRRGLVRFRFSSKSFSHLVGFPAQIQWAATTPSR